MSRTNWHKLISDELESQGESWDDVVSSTLARGEMWDRFDDGFGSSEGSPFTLWTKRRVYFPTVYDGAENVGSVPRNPNNEKTPHIGG